jgi:hypothetical protein
MDFPKRIKQHKAQSDSFAILMYKLKDLGIFRNATENDYGIDLEIEIVHDEKVIGRYLKVQIKSSEKVKLKKDGTPTVGGIKQSTLLYWIELSYRCHVVACAVDLKTERIYISKPLFWQATCLLDKTNKTKTINFLPAYDLSKEFDSSQISKEKSEQLERKIQELILKKFAFNSSISDVIFAHKTVLRNIKNIFELYADTWHYDAWTEVQQLDIFKTFLDCSKILIDLPEKINDFAEKNKNLIFSFEYWAIKTEWSYEEVSNQIAKTPLKILFPLLLKRIKTLTDMVIKGKYYWRKKDITYLRLAYSVNLPNDLSHDNFINIGYETDKLINNRTFQFIIGDDE